MKIKHLLQKTLKEQSSNLYVQIFRYLLSGGTAFVLDAGAMILLKEVWHIDYRVAAIMGVSIGLVYTYFLNAFWVFDERKLTNRWWEFWAFVLIGLVGIGLTWVCMQFFTDILGIHYVMSKLMTTAVISVWSFVVKKKFLFNKQKENLKRNE